MKMPLKKLLIILIVIIAAIVGIVAAGPGLIKTAIVIGVGNAIGAPVKIAGISLDSAEQTLTIKGFTLYNPGGFPTGKLLDASQVKIVYTHPLLVKKRLHLLHVVADLEEITVIKLEDGRMNVDSLKGVREEANIPQIGDKNKFEESKRIHIDTLTLSVKRVVYKDYTAKKGPDIQVYDVNIRNKAYNDIPGVQTLILFVLKEAIAHTAIKGVAVYGVAALTGVGFWPAGIAIVVLGKDSAEGVFKSDSDTAFRASVDTLKRLGKIDFQSKNNETIKAHVAGNVVSVKVKTVPEGTRVTVSARKLLLPMPRFAKTVLYQISEKLSDN